MRGPLCGTDKFESSGNDASADTQNVPVRFSGKIFRFVRRRAQPISVWEPTHAAYRVADAPIFGNNQVPQILSAARLYNPAHLRSFAKLGDSLRHQVCLRVMPPRKKASSPSRRSKASQRSLPRPACLAEGEKGTRLQKFLATAGVDSRRNCEEFIRTGRVTVDGETVKDPAVSVKSAEQEICLDGERLLPPRYQYFLLNKPKGVVCTNNDPAGRPRAVDLVPAGDRRLFTVGRLDENTEGLLLVTNDGALAEHLAHPRYEVVRKYRVQVAGIPTPETLGELRQGMYFSDGFFRFQHIKILKRKGRSTFVELELREGKNREIRRLMARAGHKVMNLSRIAFGPMRIGRLEIGECRELRSRELHELYDFVENTPRKRPERRPPRPKKSASKKKKAVAAEATPTGGARRGAARKTGGRGSAVGKKKPAKRKPVARGKSRGRKK